MRVGWGVWCRLHFELGVSSSERLEGLDDVLKPEELGRRLAVRVLEVDLGGLHLVALDRADPVQGAEGLTCGRADVREGDGWHQLPVGFGTI